jgi:CDP-4-dehydro-6-deoxyglucose reductase
MSKVQIRPSGHQFTTEGDESILDAALRHGYAFPYGCRNGACGACKGKVLEGGVHYGDDEPMALSEEEQEAGYALFCIGQPEGDVTIEVHEVEAVQDIPVRMLPTKVAHMERLGEVMRLWLKLPEGQRLQYLAGQYVDFLLPDGRKRAFSIANAPHEDRLLEFHIRHNKGGQFTERLFHDVHEKDLIRIEGPHGTFFLREESNRPMLMLATGTGFGPIKAIIEHALAEGSPRPIYLYWGARSTEELYLGELAQRWAAEYAHVHYRPVLSRPGPDWHGRVGYVQHAAAADFDDLSEFEMYACGHPDMVYKAREVLVAKGMASECCYADAFEWAKD